MDVRKAVAVAGLLTFAALIASIGPIRSRGVPDGFGPAMWALLLPLAVTMAGVLREAPWARRIALGGAVAVFPWALLLTLAPLGLPLGRQVVALAASVAVFAGLSGRSMASRFEGRSGRVDWRPPRMALVGWAIVANVASMLTLYLFVAAYDYRIEWHVAVPAALLLLLVLGVVALGRGKTLGILVVALSSFGLLAAATAFLWTEPHHTGEGVLLVLAFLPGLLTGWAVLFAFGRPMWRYLRGRSP